MLTRTSKHRPMALCLAGLGMVGAWASLSACLAHVDEGSTTAAAVPLSNSNSAHGPTAENAPAAASTQDPNEIHAAIFESDPYPSARSCGVCHPKHFNEWSASPHAYAQISPIFNTMQSAVTTLTNGTNADFCIRCHSPVAMALGEPTLTENKNRHQSALEGITCIICHRVNGDYGKISGRFKVEPGDIFAPINSPGDGGELERVLSENAKVNGEYEDIKTSEGGAGEYPIHDTINTTFFLQESSSCGNCHDVTSPGGFRLEEAFSEWKSSPAGRDGVSCQDCHMSPTEGRVSDTFEEESIAILPDGTQTRPRKVTRHYFAGPDYSIVHPGIFPILNKENAELATLTEWVDFDLSWGRDEFEANVPEGADFKHEVWENARNRRLANRIIYGPSGQMDKLETYRLRQLEVLREGYQVGRVDVQKIGPDGLKFRIEVKNGTDGHNVPTGFIAERTLFLEVEVLDRNGERVFISGDTDPNGDVRDLHSVYVHNGALPLDEYLFSLQSKFMVRLFRGGEREQVLPLNFSASPLLFNRPAATPTIATGRPPGVRIHRVGIAPLGNRWANYRVDDDALATGGPYTVKVRMIAGMVPSNLIDAIHIVGFDYGMNPRQVADRVVAGRPTLWTGEFTLDEVGDIAVDWQAPKPGPIEWWQKPGEGDAHGAGEDH